MDSVIPVIVDLVELARLLSLLFNRDPYFFELSINFFLQFLKKKKINNQNFSFL